MSLPNEVNPQLLASSASYTIDQSLRFRSSASAYLNRTPASASNRKTWTWSAWVKRGTNNDIAATNLFTSYSASSDSGNFQIAMIADTLRVFGWNTVWRNTTQVFRDFSAWYHIVVAVDTTQATANNRIRVYVNGTEVTAFATLNNPSPSDDLAINQAALHRIGAQSDTLAGYWDGYLTEINFIDGQQLTPSSFGQADSQTGVWQPKKYAGTYGTNGFYLPFTDNSGATSTTIGKDFSGNGNNWTPNNISVTAGSTYDSMTDVPTLTSATAANYAVLNLSLIHI